MLETKFEVARRLRQSGLSLIEIMEATDLPYRKVRVALNQEILLRVAQRLLRRVPTWWESGEAAWKHCIHSNFCDVLEDAA